MDELVSIGSEQKLKFDFRWIKSTAPTMATAADATRAGLRVSLRGWLIWGSEQTGPGFVWTWVELLEHLSDSWPSLMWEEGLPRGLPYAAPRAVRTTAESLWRRLPAETRRPQEEAYEAFEENHNLARAVQGALMPPLWIVRNGALGYILTEHLIVPTSFSTLITTLEEVGNLLAARLEERADDRRGEVAIQRWENREDVPLSHSLSIATGLSSPELQEIQGNRTSAQFWEIEENFAPNELLAVARLSSALPSGVIATVLDAVSSQPPRTTDKLDLVSKTATKVVTDLSNLEPFEQGYALARWLRTELQLGQARVNPDEVLEFYSVPVVEVKLKTTLIDACGLWGDRHGTAVLLNMEGRHNQTVGGRRASLAHELAHLLVDRAGALPYAEVLGGNVFPPVEARAGAFAAEFLLPMEHAGAVMSVASDPRAAVRGLQTRFGVSQEVVAWQARNSGKPLQDEIIEFLRSKVSHPEAF